MIYSPQAIDYSAGVTIIDTPLGKCLKPNKIGCMVMTIEEAEACLEHRRKYGDLQPQLLKEEFERFVKTLSEAKRKC